MTAGEHARWWRDLYDWLETEAMIMERYGDEVLSAQGAELLHVRDHMRGVDPSLPADLAAGLDLGVEHPGEGGPPGLPGG
jgi:hypothetical protein